ncbi:phage major capsid protein [Phocaeicola sp.]
MRKEFETIAEYKEQMRSMLDKAEAEKRALDATEKEHFEKLKTEKELLEMKVERRALEDVNAGLVSDRRALFSQAVYDVVNHRSLEDYNGAVTENGIKVVERAADVITDTASVANMVPVTIGEVIEPLEQGLVIDKLGIKMQSGLVGELVFPTLAAIEASIQGENAEVGDTALEIGKITSTPRRISISVPVSKRAINQSNYSLQGIVLKQISLGVARLMNKWMFSGTQLSGASKGVFVRDTDVEYDTALTFANVVELETVVMNEGVDVTDGTAAYVCTPKVYGKLKSTPIEKGSAEMILQNGMVNGYPVLVTNYMDADSIGFGVFSYCGIGQFGDMDLIIDPYTGAKKNIVNFVLNTDVDIVTARTEAFAIARKKAQ